MVFGGKLAVCIIGFSKKKEIESRMSDEEMKEFEKFVLDNAYWLEKLPTKKEFRKRWGHRDLSNVGCDFEYVDKSDVNKNE